MPSPTGNRRLLPLLTALFIMGLGLYLSALSFWRLVQTATFMRTSSTVIAVVEDVRQRPFDSFSEALTHGNLAWGGSTAYQPIVAFTIADGRRVHIALPDLNSDDYTLRSELEVRVPLQDFTKAREYRNSALWGGPMADLVIGLLCAWLGLILLKIRKRTAQRMAQRKASPASREAAPSPRTESVRARAGQQTASEEVRKERTPRRRAAQASAPSPPAPADASTTAAPPGKKQRTPRSKAKTNEATGTAPRRRSSKKKTA